MNEKDIVLYSIIAAIFIIAVVLLLCLKKNFNNYLKQSNDIVQLTELYTYDGMVKRLKAKDARLISILSMCIKNSDELHNSLGTKGFDVILVNIANILRKKLDPKLRLAAHFSYDTFSIAIASSDAGLVMQYAEDISQELEKYNNDLYNIELYYGYDIGYENVVTLERSLLALKFAVRRNQSILQYNDDIVNIQSTFDRVLHEPSIISEQFKVYYQPKINATTGEIVGAEALSRWVDIDGNIFMNPAQYISEFESNGLIVKLDLFVLEEACKLLENMHKRSQKLITISLNFSRIDFEYENLIDEVTDIISRYVFNKEFLHIEITESAYIKNEGLMVSKMQQLNDLGLAIEMDDFGSGYSSMETLMNSKFNVVKMDRIFVENNLKLQSEQVFLESLVKMFKGVEMDVTVEGVESAYVVKQIRKMAPNVLIQGYYFFKPLPLSKFERVLMDDRFVLDDIFNEEVIFDTEKTNDSTAPQEDNNREINESIKLETPEVVISEDGIASWNKIQGASSYIYRLNNKKEVSTIALSVKLKNGDSIVVKAVGDSNKYENSDYSLLDSYFEEVIVNNPIQLPQIDVSISNDGIASWNVVTGAVSYVYKINNKKEISTYIPSVKLKNGDSIVVKAIGDGKNYLTGEYSLLDTYTENQVVNKTIKLPQLNVEISEDGIATWDKVDGALSYVYKINNKKEVSTTALSVKLNDGDSIVVKAIGDGENYLTGEYSLLDTYSIKQQILTVVQLPQLNVEISEDGIATWDKVDGALSYVYKINNKKEISTTALSVKLNDGDSIVVKAIGDGENYISGQYSLLDTYTAKKIVQETKRVIQLPQLNVEISEDGIATWDKVDGALSYVYKINNKKEISTTALSVKLNDGDSIVVKAIGDGENYISGQYSLLDTYTAKVVVPEPKKVIKLSTPLVTVTDAGLANWNSISNAASYVYKINGGEETSTTALRVQLTDEDSIVVKAIGDGINYVDGEYSKSVIYNSPFDDFDLDDYDDGYDENVTEEELAVGADDESDEDEEARVLRLIEIYKKQYRDEWEAEMLKKYPELMKKHYERKQFLEKLVNLDNTQCDNYNKLKNEIMKYKGLKNRTTNYFDTFILKTSIIVKLGVVGKSIRLYLALDPNAYPEGQFRHKDISDTKRHAKTPFLLKVSSNLSVKRAIILIHDLAVKFKLEAKEDYVEKNYVKGMKLQHYKNKQQ